MLTIVDLASVAIEERFYTSSANFKCSVYLLVIPSIYILLTGGDTNALSVYTLTVEVGLLAI
jgi:hypothetical protein